MKRLTVHLAEVKKTDIDTGKKVQDDQTKKWSNVTKRKLFNTISVNGLRTTVEVNAALSEIRKTYKIAVAKDDSRSNWRIGEEMYYISNIN